VIFAAPQLAFAHTTPKKVPIDELARHSEMVVVGRVQAVTKVKSDASPIGSEYSEIKILAALKGDKTGTILLWNKTVNSEINSMCCAIGSEYVFFLNKAADGNYFVNGGQYGAILVQPN